MRKIHKIILILGLFLITLGVNVIKAENYKITEHDTTNIKYTHNYTISGKVIDENNLPLQAATVCLFDKTGNNILNISTDKYGKFKIVLKKEVSYIEVTMIGFKKKTLMNLFIEQVIVLENEIQNLEEFVVTGYMKKKAESYTGAVKTIKKEELLVLKGKNILEAIQMYVPGVEIKENNETGSNPNVVPDIIIRGRSSFSGKNSPLFILDGFEVDLMVIFDLDINTVESVTILKDASATAFYGAKASNGVVVVNTKEPEQGKLRVAYNLSYGITQPDLASYNLLTASEKLEYEKLAGNYDDLGKPSLSGMLDTKNYNERLKRVLEGVESDWLSQALRTGIDQTHSLSLSGGNQRVRYSISGYFSKREGVMKESERKRKSINFNLQYKHSKKLVFRNSINISKVEQEESPYGSFATYTKMNPYDRIKTEQGTYNKQLSYDLNNPVYEANIGSYNRSNNLNINNILNAKWYIMPQLRIESIMGLTWYKKDGEIFLSPLSNDFKDEERDKRGTMDLSNEQRNSLQGKLFMSYEQMLGTNNLFSINIGLNADETEIDNYTMRAIGFLSQKLDHVSFGTSYKSSSRPSGQYLISRTMGAFLNANYIINNTYFVDASLRSEGSSKFGKDSRDALFWSLGLGWNIHKEDWINKKIINRLKLRGSIGEDGNSQFDPYQAITTYRYSNTYNYYKGIGAMIIAMSNPNLQWETTLKMNMGIDFSLFSDRVFGTINAYKNNTNELLLPTSTAPSTGFSQVMQNLGQVENKGLEALLNINLYKGKEINCVLSLSASHNKNTILKISNSLKQLNEEKNNREYSSSEERYSQIRKVQPLYEEGESTTALKVVKTAGVDPSNGKLVYIKRDGTLTYEYDYKDKVKVGDITPKVQGNGGLSFFYKNFGFSTRFIYRLGAKNYNSTLANKIEGVNPKYNVDNRVLESRWKKVNDITKYRNIKYRYGTEVYATDRFIKTEYMIGFSSINLSYNISNKICKKLQIRDLLLNLTLNDIGRISTIKKERGTNYPFARTVLLSMNLKF